MKKAKANERKAYQLRIFDRPRSQDEVAGLRQGLRLFRCCVFHARLDCFLSRRLR